MSIIQSIRDKAAWIVSGAIALALIAFIVEDGFRSKSLFGGNTTTMGVVNGTKIDAAQFEERYKRAEEMYRQQGYPLNDMMRNNIRDGLWGEYVDDAIMSDKYDALGITVSDKELSDILYGENPPQDLRQQFTDKNTGLYDPNAAYQQIQALKKQKNTPQYQSFFTQYLPALAKQRQREKYLSLLGTSSYVPKWLVEKITADNSQKASISYVNIPYSTISDSAVKVSDGSVKEYVDAHKEEFKQENARTIEYVVFDAGPTKEDSAAIFSQVNALKSEFNSTNDVSAFMVRNGSETPYNDAFQLKSKISSQNIDTLAKLNEGEVAGPYFEGGNYVLAKMIAKRNMPDSVKVRHILIKTAEQGKQVLADSIAKKRMDSVAAAIKGGANFDSMVVKYTDDEGSRQKGGVYEFASSQFQQISKEFAETIFYGVAGDKKTVHVENPQYSGYHYIEVLSQKGFEPAFKIAEYSKAILPSSETTTRENGLAAQFAAQSRSKSQFDENAKKQNLNKIIAADLKPLDASITALGSSRELVKWAFTASKDDVAETPYQVEDKYVVPVLTGIYKEGSMPVEKARPLVENILRNKEKARQITAKIGNVSSLEAAANAAGQNVNKADSILFGSPFIPNVGQEPRVIGASFDKSFTSKPSGPIAGNGGVFIIKVDNVSAITTTAADAQQQQMQMQQSQQRAFSDPRMVSEILKKTVKITDNRAKFF
ncbi:MAG: SurA N-terminal domain-containing protein [Chitinophagaceae bacterium]|nr:SurA N-terminal domain-containing protein [Chitinophagaceae bacterium]